MSIVTLVISRFGFEGGILILIAPVPGHRLLIHCTRYWPLRTFYFVSYAVMTIYQLVFCHVDVIERPPTSMVMMIMHFILTVSSVRSAKVV